MEEPCTSIAHATSFEGLDTSVLVPESLCPELTVPSSLEDRGQTIMGTSVNGGPDHESPWSRWLPVLGPKSPVVGLLLSSWAHLFWPLLWM